jgi:hypothetical protein
MSAADRAGLRAELSQLTNFLWMGSLLGLIDLLPWEKLDGICCLCRS